MADPSRDVILEAVHFLVEIGNPRHARLSGMLSISSYGVTPQRPNNLAAVFRGIRCPLLAQSGHEKKSVNRGSGPAYAVAADPNARSKAIRELLCITAFFALQNSTRVGCSLLTHL